MKLIHRAIAVILVIIYHMDFGIFTGGFIGVDVFVISGYLITKQIITNYSKKKFYFYILL